MQSEIITLFDWLLLPFYLLLIFIAASYIKKERSSLFKYFIPALFAKLAGAIGLCLIYVYYYQGGDTLNYHADSSVLLKLLFHSPSDFFNVWLSPLSKENLSYFTSDTGYLVYGHDPTAFMVCRLLVLIKLVSFDSYLVSSALMAVVSFSGTWKLYRVFCDCYPALYKHFAVSVLFIPSVLFWGSGLLKDSWTFSATGWYCYSFYMIFIRGNKRVFPIITLVISMFILITIKPYIFVGLLPGSLLWMIWSRIGNFKSKMIKIIVAPFIVTVGIGIGIGMWMITSSNLGEYNSLDSMIQKASVSYEDLKQDYYQGNTFDLGEYDPTFSGLLSKFPIAVFTGLFRPFLWEAKNIIMFFSGLETFCILCFALFVLLSRPIISIKKLFSNPVVLFCLSFAVSFAFSVAISTSNFGAMVRLRMPLLPFFLCGLTIIEYGNPKQEQPLKR